MYFALLLLNHDVYCHHVRVKLRTWTEPQRYTSSLQCEKEHVSYKQLRHRNETWACKWLHVSTSNISSYHIASVKLIGKETIFPTPNYSCKRTNKQTNKGTNEKATSWEANHVVFQLYTSDQSLTDGNSCPTSTETSIEKVSWCSLNIWQIPLIYFGICLGIIEVVHVENLPHTMTPRHFAAYRYRRSSSVAAIDHSNTLAPCWLGESWWAVQLLARGTTNDLQLVASTQS